MFRRFFRQFCFSASFCFCLSRLARNFCTPWLSEFCLVRWSLFNRRQDSHAPAFAQMSSSVASTVAAMATARFGYIVRALCLSDGNSDRKAVDLYRWQPQQLRKRWLHLSPRAQASPNHVLTPHPSHPNASRETLPSPIQSNQGLITKCFPEFLARNSSPTSGRAHSGPVKLWETTVDNEVLSIN